MVGHRRASWPKKTVVFARLNLDQNSELNYLGNGWSNRPLKKHPQETVQKTVPPKNRPFKKLFVKPSLKQDYI
jgi:hypothetical protein